MLHMIAASLKWRCNRWTRQRRWLPSNGSASSSSRACWDGEALQLIATHNTPPDAARSQPHCRQAAVHLSASFRQAPARRRHKVLVPAALLPGAALKATSMPFRAPPMTSHSPVVGQLWQKSFFRRSSSGAWRFWRRCAGLRRGYAGKRPARRLPQATY